MISSIIASQLISAPERHETLTPATGEFVREDEPRLQVSALINGAGYEIMQLKLHGERENGIGLVEFSGIIDTSKKRQIQSALSAVATGSWHGYIHRKRIEQRAEEANKRSAKAVVEAQRNEKARRLAEKKISYQHLLAYMNAVRLSTMYPEE